MVKKRTWALSLLFVILFIFSVSLIAVGATVHNQRIKGFAVGKEQQACTPSSVKVVEYEKGQWLAVWNEHMVEDVYATRDSKELAEANLNDYKLNQTYPCLCSRILHEGVWDVYHGACYFNMNATRAVVQTQMIYKYGSDALISVGSLIFLSMVIIIGILLHRERKKNDFIIIEE